MERMVNTFTEFGGGDMIKKKIPGSQPSNYPLTLFGGTGDLEAYRHPLWEPTCPRPSLGYQLVARGRLRFPPDSLSPSLPSSSPRPLQSPSTSPVITLPRESLPVTAVNSAFNSWRL